MNSSIIGASGDGAFRHSPPKPVDVCPHCKRPLSAVVERYGFCKEHHEVVPMRSAVNNDYQTPDWSAE